MLLGRLECGIQALWGLSGVMGQSEAVLEWLEWLGLGWTCFLAVSGAGSGWWRTGM